MKSARIPLPWNQVFMRMAETIALRSKDPDQQVGACLVNLRNEIISFGFNGASPNVVDYAIDWGDSFKNKLMIHAEGNALFYAGRERANNAVMYVTHFPCHECIKLMGRYHLFAVYYGKGKCNHQDEDYIREGYKIAAVHSLSLFQWSESE